MIHAIGDWFGYWTGVTDESGKGYGFWSGIGSCLTYLGILAAVWRHVNCHARGCWRVGKHPVEGTPYKACRKHHPTVPDRGPTVEDIRAAHLAARPSSP